MNQYELITLSHLRGFLVAVPEAFYHITWSLLAGDHVTMMFTAPEWLGEIVLSVVGLKFKNEVKNEV